MGSFVDSYYSVAKFQAAYAEIIPSITDRSQWPEVDKGFTLQPPVQKKREPGRLRKNRIKPARETGGKATRQVRCPNCREYGHRASSWKCALNGTKKRCQTTLIFKVSIHHFLLCNHLPFHIFCRKRSKKKPAKPGRKKKANPTATAAAEQPTPRTRGALATEAAAKAKRDAEEAELKAAAARQAAEEAAREEVEATRNEFASSIPEPSEQSPLQPMALVVVNAPQPIQTTPPA